MENKTLLFRLQSVFFSKILQEKDRNRLDSHFYICSGQVLSKVENVITFFVKLKAKLSTSKRG